jgi:hypothetical protein
MDCAETAFLLASHFAKSGRRETTRQLLPDQPPRPPRQRLEGRRPAPRSGEQYAGISSHSQQSLVVSPPQKHQAILPMFRWKACVDILHSACETQSAGVAFGAADSFVLVLLSSLCESDRSAAEPLARNRRSESTTSLAPAGPDPSAASSSARTLLSDLRPVIAAPTVRANRGSCDHDMLLSDRARAPARDVSPRWHPGSDGSLAGAAG